MSNDLPAPREVQINVRVRETAAAEIDKARGNWPRPEWVRQACALALKQGLRGPNGGL